MSAAVSFAEIEDQQVELLPARTVMSLYAGWFGGGGYGYGGGGGGGGGGGNGGFGGYGGSAQGGLGANVIPINVLGTQNNLAGNAIGGTGGFANGGIGG